MPSAIHRAFFACAVAGILALGATPVRADDAQDVSKLMHGGQLDQALQKVDSVLAQKPRDAQMRFFKGLILTEQGKTQDAIGVFLHLTEDYPELPEPYNNLAVLYASQGEYDKARAALEMAIRTHPSYATAHENLGDVYAKLASQAYDKALQLDSSNSGAQSKLALIRELISLNTPGARKPTTVPTATPVGAPTPAKTPPLAAASKASSPGGEATVLASAAPAAPKPSPATAAPTAPSVVAASSANATPPGPATAPATPPGAASSPGPAPSAESGEVSDAVMAWAHAWESKDVTGYLAAYASDFATPTGETRQQWEDERRARIVGKSAISVKIENLEIDVKGDHATARFRQDYRADHLSANSRKTLILVKSNGKWLIQQEHSGA